MARIPNNPYEALGEMLRPPPPPGPIKDRNWVPHLNRMQLEVYNATERYILCWGEKGGSKTWGVLNKLVKHLYNNQNALAIIGVRVRSMANKGGAWDKLLTYILPEWREGMGLEFSEVQKDSQHNEFVWVANKFGSWCCVVLISAPHASQLRDRMPGYEPSFVFWDELTKCDSEEYFRAPAIQIGRRPGVLDIQQYVGACNPEGESHWVYQKWFIEPFDEVTQQWDPEFRNIYFPVDENKDLEDGYLDGLKKIYRKDPIEAARMLSGQWIDRPTAEALFREIFNVVKHVSPLNEDFQPDRRNRLMPDPGFPIIIGLDPGAVFNAFIFMQWLPVGDIRKWMIFDEAVTIRKRVNYRDFIPIIIRKVKFWREVAGAQMPQVWISDNSAFNQFRAAQGSFDVLELQKFYEAARGKYQMEDFGRIKQCPKAPGSVLARVQLMQDLLCEDKVLVSSGCPRVIAMLNGLEGSATKPGEALDPEKLLTPKRSDHVHTFDATTYPILMASLSPTALLPSVTTGQTMITPR